MKLGKVVFGAVIGAAAALLFAPKKGSELRDELKTQLDDLALAARDIDVEEIKSTIIDRTNEIRAELESLTAEDVKDIASERGAELLTKSEELLEYIKEEGYPSFLEYVEDIKETVLDYINEAKVDEADFEDIEEEFLNEDE